MPSAPADLKILDVQPGAFVFASWHGVNIVVWHGTATMQIVQRFEQAIIERSRLHPLMSSVHIVTGEAKPPEPEVRDAIVAINDRYANTAACGAVVIERKGVAGIALRSAITGLIILAPKQYRIKVFETLEPCAPWVVDQHLKRTGVELDVNVLTDALLHVRAAAQ